MGNQVLSGFLCGGSLMAVYNWYDVIEPEYNRYTIDIAEWLKPKPFGISGCFRLRDESEFMVDAIETHLPYLDEAVLVVQESSDNTVELAERLAEQWKCVRVVHYPVIPHFIDHPQFQTDPVNSIYSFVYLSNWALSQCRFSWIAKTEGDVIALPEFGNIVKEIKQNPTRWQLYGRVVLNVAGANYDQVSATNPRNGGWDECVVPNYPNMAHFIKADKWEVLRAFAIPSVCFGWSGVHMKRCKKEFLPVWNDEEYVDATPENIVKVLLDFNAKSGYAGIDDPLANNGRLFDDFFRYYYRQ